MFFLTGLPRSRTTWFSEYFTALGYPCMHNGFEGCNTFMDYIKKTEQYAGDCNTGFIHKWLQLTEYFNSPKVVVIRRSVEEVKKSTRLYGNLWKAFDILLNAFVDTYPCLEIQYKDINKSLPEICSYLGLTYSQEITDNFISKTIATDPWDFAGKDINQLQRFYRSF